jgi:hypothetical protein
MASKSSILYNELGVSKDIIEEILNHSETDRKITQLYVQKDWTVIWRANRKFINKIFSRRITSI